jgi:hypothetical protein
MRAHSLGKKVRADLMEPRAGLQHEPFQHLRFRHTVNALNFYFVDFQPTLKNRTHLSRDQGQPPSEHRKPDNPLPRAQRAPSPGMESFPTHLLALIRDLTGTGTLPVVHPRADFRRRPLPSK